MELFEHPETDAKEAAQVDKAEGFRSPSTISAGRVVGRHGASDSEPAVADSIWRSSKCSLNE